MRPASCVRSDTLGSGAFNREKRWFGACVEVMAWCFALGQAGARHSQSPIDADTGR
jgi:hypothetical protein